MDSELSRRQVLTPEGGHETDTATVQQGVQAGGSAAAGERSASGGCRAGAGGGRPGDSALAGPGEDRPRDGVSGQWASGAGGGGAPAAPQGGRPAPGGAGFPKKSGGVLREGIAVRYQAVRAAPRGGSIGRRCALLGVSRSGYYATQCRPASARARVNQQLVVEMRRIHREVDRSYGSPRMQPELVGAGFACGRHRVARLMRAAGLRAKQPNQYCITTDSRHSFAIAPNLLDREFRAAAPNRVWMGDMTYIPTAEGWCYLAVLLDAFSRRVVGWALDTHSRPRCRSRRWRKRWRAGAPP